MSPLFIIMRMRRMLPSTWAHTHDLQMGALEHSCDTHSTLSDSPSPSPSLSLALLCEWGREDYQGACSSAASMSQKQISLIQCGGKLPIQGPNNLCNVPLSDRWKRLGLPGLTQMMPQNMWNHTSATFSWG